MKFDFSVIEELWQHKNIELSSSLTTGGYQIIAATKDDALNILSNKEREYLNTAMERQRIHDYIKLEDLEKIKIFHDAVHEIIQSKTEIFQNGKVLLF